MEGSSLLFGSDTTKTNVAVLVVGVAGVVGMMAVARSVLCMVVPFSVSGWRDIIVHVEQLSMRCKFLLLVCLHTLRLC